MALAGLCAVAEGVLEAPGGRRLLGLEMRLPCGGVVVVHGPNGAGKTLLLRRLAGLGPGRIRGRVWAARPRFYAPPGDIHLEGLLVREWYWLHSLPVPRPLRGLEGVGLERLSRGWRRLAGLLAPSTAGARVMLLDEPFTGLDDERGGLLAEALGEAARRGSLVVVAVPSGEAGRVTRLLDGGRAPVALCPVRGRGELRCP